jgi:phospholipid/cholesterol/gamma-HCH transport system permease protein
MAADTGPVMAREGALDRPVAPPLADELGEIAVRGLRPGRQGLEALGEMVLLGGAVLTSLRTGIVWDELILQCEIFFKRMIVPVLLIGLGWGTMVSLEAGNLLSLAQASFRLGGFEAMSHIREFDAFVMGDIAMGVAGTAIVADMGARKVRDELAAMSTLGIDVVREMVTPRVLSMVVMTSAMLFPMMVSSLFTGWLAAVYLRGASTGGFWHDFFNQTTSVDVLIGVVKCACFGFFGGIIACYKGMSAAGGGRGVGRAVNEAVVMSIIMAMSVNYLVTSIIMALNSSVNVLK